MIKAIFKYNFFLIFAIAFAIPVAIISFFFAQNINYAYIAANGIETTGYVIPDSYWSNLSINDVDYYHVEYYFYDDYGITYYGKTSDAYLYYEVLQLEDIGEISIKYDPNTFDSIESTFDLFKDGTTLIFIIFLVAFGIADIIFWVISIKTIKNNIALINVEKSGTEYDAVVTHINTNLTVNGVEKFKVYYTWKNEMGQEFSGSSNSKYVYYQAKNLEDLKNIRIKAIGNKSYILTDPDSIHIDHNNPSQEQVEQNIDSVPVRQEYCDYCGEKVSSSDVYCPNCGAKLR